MNSLTQRTAVLVPAYNEEACIAEVLAEIKQAVPGMSVVVVNDGSVDRTAARARSAGADVLDLPCNLGVGGAVQTGFRYLCDSGFDFAVRLDGDGQHPASVIPRMLEEMEREPTDLIIASRFLGEGAFKNSLLRQCGIHALVWLLSTICRKRVTDPTSGFQMVSRPLLYYFSRSYPVDYPEPEALALMRRQGYDFREIPATFAARKAGNSTIQGWGTLYYVLKVFLALVVDRARPVDVRFSRSALATSLEDGAGHG